MSTDQDRQSRPGRSGNKRGNKKPPLPTYRRGPFSYLAILALVILAMTIFQQGVGTNTISWDALEDHLEADDIASLEIGETKITGEFRESAVAGEENPNLNFSVDFSQGIARDRILQLRDTHNFTAEITFARQHIWLYIFMQYMFPLLLLVGLFYFLFARNMRGGAGGMLMSFGRSRHKLHGNDKVRVTFNDVAGIEEAKEEVSEIIEFLKNPKKFQRLGGRIPRGVLLSGPPGCGKTLLAKAIAGEADVPFFSISGSDFVEMFVGVGASRVRDLFKQAKDNSPCIIFLDEVDAIGRKRGASFAGGGHDEREQTLNAILVEMDGFGTDDQVIVIAATNRGDILDNALTRPGRFDRQVVVPLPDLKGRAEILGVHAKKVKIGASADFERLARGTPMFSGADLAAIINEAALAATMADKEAIEMEDLDEARDKVRWGRAKRSRMIDHKERNITAYHEAGHTIVQCLLDDADPLHKVSIIPRGPMGGATFSLPEMDRTLFTRNYCLALMQICYGGRIAEELFCDDISSGAQNDIEQATRIAKQMILTWGMSPELGPVHYGSDSDHQDAGFAFPSDKEYSEKTAEDIDREIRALIQGAYQTARDVIENNRDRLVAVAEALLRYETLDAQDVKIILDGGELQKPTVSDLLAAEQAKTPQEETSEEHPPETNSEGEGTVA